MLRRHVTGEVGLKAPDSLHYELCNAVLEAERGGRLSQDQGDQILRSMQGLKIELVALELGETLPLARQFDRSAYDAAYLALAARQSDRLITGDRRLYNAVHPQLEWVLWIEDYLSSN